MATVVSITNPITGAVEQVDKLDHTAQQIDDAVALAPQLSNPNLLDNWYFANPVNQRGQTSYSVNGYTIDRWYTAHNISYGTLTVDKTAGCVTISHVDDGGFADFIQTLENPAMGIVTLSVLMLSGNLYSATGTLGNISLYTDEIYIRSNSPNIVALRCNTGKTISMIAAKLELGSQQTLAHQDADGNWILNEIPDYGEQLRRCQRYFCRFNFDRNDLFFGSLSTNLDKAWITIPTPVVMRTAPSVSFSTTFNVVIRGNGFQLEALASNSTVAADTSTIRCCNILITPNTKPSAWTAQQVVMIYTSSPWYMDCSADL